MGDADIALRHIARRKPDDLARALVPEGHVEVVGWMDSQVTRHERRLDKAVRLRVDGEPRVLHVEFCYALRGDVPDRIFEYLGFLFSALRAEAPGETVPPIESVAVVLSGRKRPWPATGACGTGWPDRPFSGTHFRIDAVYQHTVAELRARGSVLWLVFTPLARDANVEALKEVIAEIGAAAMDEEERDELLAAFILMASVDPWGHNLHEALMSLMEDEEEGLRRRAPIIGAWIIEAEQKGREEAVVALLGRLFARRVGRQPTTVEERSIVERARAIGPTEVEDALLDLDRDALVRWLSEPLPATGKAAAARGKRPARRR